jgi:predicted secreted protein
VLLPWSRCFPSGYGKLKGLPTLDQQMKTPPLVAIASAILLGGSAAAQVLPAPENVLQLSASGSVEVQQDLLIMSLSATREGADPAIVQSQLKLVLDAALAEARKSAQAGQMDVRTGNFAVYPRYTQQGRIGNWQGTAELVLEGRDIARITQAAGRVPGMTLSGVSFGLSREQRAKVEGDAQALAIERFKSKSSELAQGFGFRSYTLREVSVNSNDMQAPRPRMMATEARAAAADAPVPVEAGKATVTVTVSGSVQLR